MALEGKGPAVSIESEDELPEVNEGIVTGLSEKVCAIIWDTFK